MTATKHTPRAPKGHRLIRSWSGCNDTFAGGRCECGKWSFNGWTERMAKVVRSHAHHREAVRAALAKAGS